MAASILGIACHLPARVQTNEDLARANPDWKMDALQETCGIQARHIAAPDETAADLGLQAAGKLLERRLVDPGEIDFLLYCTQSPDHYLPSTSCVLQHQLGLGKHIGALDFNLGCSGYVYGLFLAKCFILNGAARNVLLIAADTYTKYIHPRDRTVRVLFGDGATATLVGGTTTGTGRIGEFVLGTNGSGAENLIVPSGGLRKPRSDDTAIERTDAADCTRSEDNLYMNGKAIFAFAITTVPRAVSALLAKASLSAEDVDWYVYHQANKFMLENLAGRSKVPADKMVMALEDVGNTVSSSIPIAVERYVQAGKIRPGHRLMLIGFGVGYSWAACEMIWG